MQVATFVIAVLGLVVSAVNATWSVAQWRLNGGRPTVDLIVGAVASDGSGLVSMPAGTGNAPNQARLAKQGFTRPVVGVTVTNTGRLPVRVQRWSIQCAKNGTAFTPVRGSMGPDLPYVLEAGAQETWVVDLQAAKALSSAVVGTVQLGTGQSLKTKQSLRVA